MGKKHWRETQDFKPESLKKDCSKKEHNICYKIGYFWKNATYYEGNHNTYSYEELGKIIGVKKQSVSKYLDPSKSDSPEMDRVLRFVKHFKIPLIYFLDDEIEAMSDPKQCAIPERYREKTEKEICEELGYEYKTSFSRYWIPASKQMTKNYEKYIHDTITEKMYFEITKEGQVKLQEMIKKCYEELVSDEKNTAIHWYVVENNEDE